MYILLLIGGPGTFYTGLSVGQHTIDVRFTPTGSTQVTAFQLQFNIAGNYLLCICLSIKPLLTALLLNTTIILVNTRLSQLS